MEKISAIVIMGLVAALSGAVVGAMAGGSVLWVQVAMAAAFAFNAAIAWTALSRRRAWARCLMFIGCLGFIGAILCAVMPTAAWLAAEHLGEETEMVGAVLLWGPLRLAELLEIPTPRAASLDALADSRIMFITVMFGAASCFLSVVLFVVGWLTRRRAMDEESAQGWDLSSYMTYHNPAMLDPDVNDPMRGDTLD